MDNIRPPNLIDSGAKMYLFNSLQKSHINKVKYYNIWFNLGAFLAFVVIVGGILWYRWKSRPSPEEERARRDADERYILSRIRYYQDEKKKIDARGNGEGGRGVGQITDLPMGEHFVPIF